MIDALDESVIELAIDLISERQHLSFVRASVAHSLDTYDPATIKLYIDAAQAQMRNEATKDPELHRAESIAYLRGILRSPNTSTGERIRAQAQLAQLLGLIATDDKTSAEQRATDLRDALAAMADALGENDDDPTTTTPESDAAE